MNRKIQEEVELRKLLTIIEIILAFVAFCVCNAGNTVPTTVVVLTSLIVTPSMVAVIAGIDACTRRITKIEKMAVEDNQKSPIRKSI
jgi:ubiquitin C-terminal hydrolase